MYRKLSNIAAILFTIGAVSYGAVALTTSPKPTVIAENTVTPFQASGGYTQQGPIVGVLGACHFTLSGVPGAGTYVAYEEPCDHSTFVVSGTRYRSNRQFRVILNGNGGYIIALANRYMDTSLNITWIGTVYANDGMYQCSWNGAGTMIALSGSDFNCSGSAPWGGLCNSAGGNATLTVSP